MRLRPLSILEVIMDLIIWLLSVVDLFDDTLDAVQAVAILGFFLHTLLFLTVLRLMAWLIVRGAKRRL